MKTYYIKDKDYVTEHFTASELACKGSGVLKFHDDFLYHLEDLRIAWGKPLIPNSCCRSPEHNKAVGGKEGSLHLTENPKHPTTGTMAIDINTASMEGLEAGELHNLARDLGWSTGNGLKQGFLHLDRRIDIGMPRTDFFY